MYHEYAYYSGFEIRKGSQKTNLSGIVRQKYYLCHRAGERKKVNIDSLERNEKQVRKSSMESTGCKARVRFDLDYLNETYIIADFHAIHNHELVPREYRHLCKTDRQLKYAEQLFVYNASISNVGPTKAHQLYSNLKGSSLNVNGTVDDFRNWKRDLNVYINESDAQILVNKMMEMREHIPGFAFEYKVDNSELHSLFWADNVARRNYEEFSDIMSFDATYRTNRYNMMFVPFTGIDNHNKCVTFAAGLIRDEKQYTWLLKCFMDNFKKEPTMVVTDQDKAMEIGIKNIFKTAKHRLCMWHITQKLPTKKEIEAGLYDCLVVQMTAEEECQIYIINEMLKRKVKETRQNVIQYKTLSPFRSPLPTLF
uniref:protein FAR1-RELATED SEQUENCE 5-like n=1 Tax=Erigeron canadensis TaxID=72917 RepID=UPI001CB979DA|nr:protein FAR1-RELATED SEQUENCE 5-like [Erigeron canadensis]